MKVVTIDGPSGSGKSTVARAVAAELGLDALDTGAMYRAVAAALLAEGADVADAAHAASVARSMELSVGERVMMDGRDVTSEIRSPEVTAAVSTVAAHPEVREVLVGRQRTWVEARGGGVVEGRDIGTVVFPDAPFKLFLTASEHERATRRKRDARDGAAGGDLGEIEASIRLRDERDQRREASPLHPAADALVVDTTGRETADVVSEVLSAVLAVFDR